MLEGAEQGPGLLQLEMVVVAVLVTELKESVCEVVMLLPTRVLVVEEGEERMHPFFALPEVVTAARASSSSATRPTARTASLPRPPRVAPRPRRGSIRSTPSRRAGRSRWPRPGWNTSWWVAVGVGAARMLAAVEAAAAVCWLAPRLSPREVTPSRLGLVELVVFQRQQVDLLGEIHHLARPLLLAVVLERLALIPAPE